MPVDARERSYSVASEATASLAVLDSAPGRSDQGSDRRFLEVLEEIKAVYEPLSTAQGGEFRIEINPDDESASASAHRDRLDEFVVRLAHGFMTHPHLNEESLRITVCHEIGHLFGGFPHRPSPMEWPGPFDEHGDMVLSAEAQSDYAGALECMPLVLKDEDNAAYVSSHDVHPVVRAACGKAHPAPERAAICMRTAMAGYAMLRFVYPFPISFDAPATEIAARTIKDTYPSRQCRLDTILEGALGRPRPNCWFKSEP